MKNFKFISQEMIIKKCRFTLEINILNQTKKLNFDLSLK